MVKDLVQTPDVEGNWLYFDEEGGHRTFTDKVYLGVGKDPWLECTEEERQAWLAEHPEPELEDEPIEEPVEDNPSETGTKVIASI